MWFALIKQYWNVSLLREKPENTPHSLLLSCLVVFVFFVLIVLQWMITDLSRQLAVSAALLVAGSLVVSYLLYTWVLLRLFGLQSRFLQTLTCILAGHTAVHLVAFPLLFIMPLILKMPELTTFSPVIGVLYLALTLILAVWQFMISAYIFKHALTASWLAATLASLGLLACNILTISFW